MSQPDEDATCNQRRPSGQDTHFRGTECQYSDSTSSPASFGLMDVIHQIPTLPELLDSDAQKALSATCRSLRERFIARVQVVTVTSREDCSLVAKRMWPCLSMVISQLQRRKHFIAPSNQNGLATVHVSGGSSNQATIVLLRPPLEPADLPCMPLVAQQLAHQMRTKWLGMDSFGVGFTPLSRVRKVELDDFGIELVSQLVKGTWTRLASLSLPRCGLKAKGFWLLSQGSWPCLEDLNVSHNCLDAEGMALLAKGNWALLTSINLNYNPAVDATAIACLSAANWPVQSLMIEQALFSIDMLQL